MLVRFSIPKVLSKSEKRKNRSVKGKDKVVQLNYRIAPMVGMSIRPSNRLVVKEQEVVDKVRSMTDSVEENEIGGETDGGTMGVVVNDLRVEGERPGESVYPAQDTGEVGEDAGGLIRDNRRSAGDEGVRDDSHLEERISRARMDGGQEEEGKQSYR